MASSLFNLQEVQTSLRTLARVVRETREVLAEELEHRSRPPSPAVQNRLQETLDHLGQVREGFILTLRMGPATFPAIGVMDPTELWALVSHVLMDWGWLEQIGLSWQTAGALERVEDQVVSYAHARIALGLLPRLPAEAITYPQPRPTYADIPVPRTAGELLARIEELEQVIWQAGVMPLEAMEPAPLRRTYGFFEASVWLVERYLLDLLDRLR